MVRWLFFKPLTLGVDISVQVKTVLVLHSDTMMGVVTCNDKTQRVRKTAHDLTPVGLTICIWP